MPKYNFRKWKSNEVPVGALIRWIESSDIYHKYIITGVCDDDIIFHSCKINLTRVFRECEYSVDGGKTWLVCGVCKR